jgi:hypothetical protein
MRSSQASLAFFLRPFGYMKNRRSIDSRSAVLKIVPTRVDQGAQLQSTLGGCIVSIASIKLSALPVAHATSL